MTWHVACFCGALYRAARPDTRCPLCHQSPDPENPEPTDPDHVAELTGVMLTGPRRQG